jgi:molybdopterin biosynthesis enzyme
MIITTAGMSVDPDDLTRLAIADAGGRDLLYGTPVLPGNMFLVGWLDGPAGEIPILGVPACALFHQATVLDLILPRVLAGERLTREKLAEMGHGGYCQNCVDGCRFPVCAFGRGA